jgi:hypothetical protein
MGLDMTGDVMGDILDITGDDMSDSCDVSSDSWDDIWGEDGSCMGEDGRMSSFLENFL